VFVKNSEIDAIVAAAQELQPCEKEVLLVLIAEQKKPDVDRLIDALNDTGIEFMGGVFPGVIHGNSKYESGTLLLKLPVMFPPTLVQGLGRDTVEVPDFEPLLSEAAPGRPTALILVDGFAANTAGFLTELFNRLGPSINYFGGGAGSLSLQQEPCIFTKRGLMQDAAVVAFLGLESQLGVRHGWQEFIGPVVATRCTRNVVAELNWRNAFEVYRSVVEPDGGTPLTAGNFFDIAKAHPFGIHREGHEAVIRDPISVTPDGELVCAGEIPENTTLSFMQGSEDSLVDAAETAANESLSRKGATPRHVLVADCISRTIYLEDAFQRELTAVQGVLHATDKDLTLEGMLTFGEISSYGEGFPEFFNKTIVVGALYAPKIST